MEQGLL